jgi:7,8-dihydropterin-6-yl-methyl-4-(beta-D-ribofuranosyl)aminobenzene 5'-phosphate synthase
MVELDPVDAVEVTLVVDNFVDIFLAGAEGVRRFPLAYDFFDRQQLVAEHGFSALVTVEAGGRRSSILYDGGWKATHRLAQALPDAFVQPSVGTVLRF